MRTMIISAALVLAATHAYAQQVVERQILLVYGNGWATQYAGMFKDLRDCEETGKELQDNTQQPGWISNTTPSFTCFTVKQPVQPQPPREAAPAPAPSSSPAQ